MKNAKMTILFLIMLSVAFMVLPACQQNGGEDKKAADSTDSEDISETKEAESSAFDSIPVVDYGGAEFNFLIGDVAWTYRDIIAEELTGEALHDAKYRRYKTIEDKYNIQINQLHTAEIQYTFDLLNKSVLTDDIQYDLTYLHASGVPQTISAGLLMDWGKLQYPDFDNPWWNKKNMNAMTVKNILLLSPSPIELQYSSAICFNKQMVQDNALESPYELVKSGDWTMDKFYELCSDLSRDINGDGRWDKEDQYGFTTNNNWMLKSYLYAGNHSVLVKDENDIPQLNGNYEHLSLIVDKMMRLFTQSQASYMYEANVDGNFPISMDSGRIFAIGMHLGEISLLRNSDIDYGIVPMPKLDKAQQDYTGIFWGGFYSVPINAPAPDMSGIIFEALSAESHYTIYPVFKEQHLSIKFTRDEESINMLDMIYENIVYDMAYNYAPLDAYTNILTVLNQRKSTDVMSYMETNEPSLQSALEKIIESYDAYVN